jgi:hypothetical protein
MVKIFGFLDSVICLMLLAILAKLDVPLEMRIILPVFLSIKAFLFINDIGSVLDIVVAVLIVITIFFNIPWVVLGAVALLLGIKAILSLFAN